MRIKTCYALFYALMAVYLVAAPAGAEPGSGSTADPETQTNHIPWSTESGLYKEDPPAESLQFQFQIGAWDIVAKRFDPRTGALVSTALFEQHVEYRDEKRMVVEETTAYSSHSGDKIRYGIALRTYSVATGLWQVTFLGSHQSYPASTYQFKKHGNEIHGHGEFISPPDTTVKFKVRFFNITPTSYEWEQKYSLDGENWYLERTQSAKRRPSTF